MQMRFEMRAQHQTYWMAFGIIPEIDIVRDRKTGFYSTQKCHYLVCTRTFCNLWCRINVTILWTSGSLRISHDHFYSYKFCFISFHLSYVSARVINAVGIVCGAGSMERSGVRPSARLCVCLSRRSDVGSCCRSLRTGHWSIAAGTQAAAAGSVMLRAEVRGSPETCYTLSVARQVISSNRKRPVTYRCVERRWSWHSPIDPARNSSFPARRSARRQETDGNCNWWKCWRSGNL